MNNDLFLAELRAEIVAADERHRSTVPGAPRRRPDRSPARRPARWLAAAAAVVVLVAAATVLLRPDDAAAGFEIVPDDTGLTLRLTDLATNPEAVEDAAAAAGLDVTVTSAPVGPSMVGKFIGLTATQLVEQVQVTEGDPDGGFTAFRLPRGYSGAVELRMGRAARPGEHWAALSDATAPGELLACEQLIGQPLDRAVAAAERTAAGTVRVMLLDDGTWLSATEVRDHADATVIRVTQRSTDEIVIDAATDPEPFRSMSLPAPQGC